MAKLKRHMDIAWGEYGQVEIRGPKHNNRIVEYFRSTSYKATADEVPWCSAFACWVMERAKKRSPRSARARSWAKWGREVVQPIYGDVIVLSRGNNAYTGHVGFFVALHGEDRILLLGGNQSDRVKVSSFPLKKIVAIRRPTK